jgi:hypothetical protein
VPDGVAGDGSDRAGQVVRGGLPEVEAVFPEGESRQGVARSTSALNTE